MPACPRRKYRGSALEKGKMAGATNTEICKLFGGISYSVVAKIAQNFSRLMADDKEWRGRIKNVLGHISAFKGQPHITPPSFKRAQVKPIYAPPQIDFIASHLLVIKASIRIS